MRYILLEERGGVFAVAASGEYTGTARARDGVFGSPWEIGGGVRREPGGRDSEEEEEAGEGGEVDGDGDGVDVRDDEPDWPVCRRTSGELNELATEIGEDAVPRANTARLERIPSSALSSANAMSGSLGDGESIVVR